MHSAMSVIDPCTDCAFLTFQDRSNIGNALIAGLPQDLKMTPAQVLSSPSEIEIIDANSYSVQYSTHHHAHVGVLPSSFPNWE